MEAKSGPLDYRPEMRKVVTSSPSVTLLVTRIPSTITEEGLENIFLGFGVLNMRLVINKGGFAGVRGLNYAYVTVAGNAEAVHAIEKLNLQPPLNLGVVLKPSEEERLKIREQDLLDRAFCKPSEQEINKTRKQDLLDGVSNSPDVMDKNSINMSKGEALIDNKLEEVPSLNEINNNDLTEVGNSNEDNIFMFNNPLVITKPNLKLSPVCFCGKEATMVCSRCVGAWYCSQVCQVEGWPGHKSECGSGGQGGDTNEDKKNTDSKTEIKKRVVAKKLTDASLSEKETSSPRSTEDSPLLDTASIASKESTIRVLEQITDPSPNCRLGYDAEERTNEEDHLHELDLGFSSSPRIRLDNVQDNYEKMEEQNVSEIRGSYDSNFVVEREVKEETVDYVVEKEVKEETIECEGKEKTVKGKVNVETVDNVIRFSSKTGSFDQNVAGQAKKASEESEDEDDSPFQSILTLKKESDEDREKLENETILSSVEDDLNLKCCTNLDTPLSLSLPSTWTRVDSCTPDTCNLLLNVKIVGGEQVIKAKLGRVRLMEPMGEDVKTVMDMVLGEGRGGHVELWVKSIGWEGDIQTVDIKDNDGNDIATLLTHIGITELIDEERGVTTDTRLVKDPVLIREEEQVIMGQLDSEEILRPDIPSAREKYEQGAVDGSYEGEDLQNRKVAMKRDDSGDVRMSEGPKQLEPLRVTDVEKGYVQDGTLVRLKDIGNSSQEALVRCLEEKERAWLEEVMELSDASISIEMPFVGQLVAFRLLTRLGTKVVRAEVINVNTTVRKVQCQCLDYHDRRWEDYEKLFQPPPACLSIPPFCNKVVLLGVPDIQRKEAKLMLENVDQACLNQPLTLRVKDNCETGQVVELLDAEGNSVNQVLKEVLEPSMLLQREDSTPLTSTPTVVPLDYAVLTSYVPIPLNTTVSVIILYVESPTHLFVCPASSFEELNNFQVKLQALGDQMEKQGNLFTPVVGQLVMMKSMEDNQWYRGTVIKIHKTKAKIYCPDFGFVEKVPMNMLQSKLDSDIIRAKYWASHCALVDWGEGEQEATTEEKDRIKKTLVVSQKVDMQVINIDSVNFTVDISGITDMFTETASWNY